jgi:hypothetical protein
MDEASHANSSSRTPEAYARAADSAFGRAAARAGELTREFRIGPAVMRLRFAGPALVEPLTRALAPATPGSRPDFTICCWDSRSTSTPMPSPYWPPTAYGPKGHIAGFNTPTLHTTYQPGVNTLHLFDRTSRTGHYWMADAARMPAWHRGFPLRDLIHWWSRDFPLQMMHGGAVGFVDGGVLLAGKSGAGKSTTALACLDSDLLFASDDYVLVDTAQPYVHGLYSTAKLEPANLGRFPGLAGKISNADHVSTQKPLLYVREHFPSKVSTGFPIRAIFLPRVTGERATRLSDASAADSLTAVAATTVAQLEGHSGEAFAKIATFVHRVPSFWLETGTDLPQITRVIGDYLRSVR